MAALYSRCALSFASEVLVVRTCGLQAAPELRQQGRIWKRSGGMFGALGSVRGKKWKPFHSMYRANYLKEMRRKQEAEALAHQDEDDAVASGAAPSVRDDEPIVSTTPFQATRLLRAFDVFPNSDALIRFRTKVNVDLSRESVRGTCHLPHGLKTKVRVLAFCPDDEVDEMLKAGADVAGITEPIRRINQGWLGFDRCLASPKIMPQVMKVAKILGPRKMMPNPKSGTVVENIREAIREAKGGTLLEYRAEGAGDITVIIGDANFVDAKVLDNMKFFVQTLLRARPRTTTSTKTAATPMIAGLGQSAAVSEEAKDAYFLEAFLNLEPGGPAIGIDPLTIMPSSVGYFR